MGNMQTIDTTPPSDFPAQCIVMAKQHGAIHQPPRPFFYLRVSDEDSVNIVTLDDTVTVFEARELACKRGFEPTHWMETHNLRPMMF